MQALVIERVAGEVTDLEVLDQNVGARRQGPDDLLTARVFEVHSQTLLAAVHREVVGALAARERGSPTARIFTSERLELPDRGPEIGQQLGAVGPGENPREIQNGDVLQHNESVTPLQAVFDGAGQRQSMANPLLPFWPRGIPPTAEVERFSVPASKPSDLQTWRAGIHSGTLGRLENRTKE